MFPLFFLTVLWIGWLGPGINEGGFDAITDKGPKGAIEAALAEADASSLKGNYGNK